MNIRKLFETIKIPTGLFALLLLAPIFVESSYVVTGKAYSAEEERRAPPAARSSQTLSRRVSQIIFDVMELRDLEDYAGAVLELDTIREMYDDERLNDRETYTMWQFYANMAQAVENYDDTLRYYTEIINMGEALTPDQLESTIFTIANIHFFLEEYLEAIDFYLQYNEIIAEPDAEVQLRIASGYYQIEMYEEGVPFILRNMEIVRALGEKVERSTYVLLRAFYLSIEDYENVWQVVREMIILFNEPESWALLAQIEGQLERIDEQARTYFIAKSMGFISKSSEYRSLASYRYNADNPFEAASLLQEGIDQEVLDKTESNLSFLSQSYRASREDLLATGPLIEAGELADDGELYITLGITYSNMSDYESAVNAFDLAIENGVRRPDQVHIRRARAYLQLNRFDEGIEAAIEAGKDERSESTSATWVRSLENEKKRYDIQEANRELYEGFFR